MSGAVKPFLRSIKKLEGFQTNLMKYHHELADLKSQLDGNKDGEAEKANLYLVGI